MSACHAQRERKMRVRAHAVAHEEMQKTNTHTSCPICNVRLCTGSRAHRHTQTHENLNKRNFLLIHVDDIVQSSTNAAQVQTNRRGRDRRWCGECPCTVSAHVTLHLFVLSCPLSLLLTLLLSMSFSLLSSIHVNMCACLSLTHINVRMNTNTQVEWDVCCNSDYSSRIDTFTGFRHTGFGAMIQLPHHSEGWFQFQCYP